MSFELLNFDEASHSYTYDGQHFDGVTSILKPLSETAYFNVSPEVMERARALGVAVHKVIELDIKGTLDEDSLDDVLRPYLAAWREFLAQSGFRPLLSEQKVYSLKYRFAGTLDIFGILNGEAALIDAKRVAMVQRITGPQLAAYEIALRECKPDVVDAAVSGPFPGRINRFALQLKPGQKYQLKAFTEASDKSVFLSALTIKNWSQAA